MIPAITICDKCQLPVIDDCFVLHTHDIHQCKALRKKEELFNLKRMSAMIMNYLEKDLQTAIELTIHAGKLVQQMRKKPYNIKYKAHGEGPVTDADQAASDYLVNELSRLFPDDLIISEEDSAAPDLIQDKRIWFVDPIDGTKDFISNTDQWSTMLGMAVNGRPVLGVVYQPDQDKLYYAIDGHGAFLKTNNQITQLRVRKIEDVKDATLIQSHKHFSKRVEQIAHHLKIHKVILQGSIGLKLCMIATGEADIYLNFSGKCHLWDLCAPEIILQEAGGIVAHDNGEPISYAFIGTRIEAPILALADGIFDKIQSILK